MLSFSCIASLYTVTADIISASQSVHWLFKWKEKGMWWKEWGIQPALSFKKSFGYVYCSNELMQVCVTTAFHFLCQSWQFCVRPWKTTIAFEMAIKCQMKRFPGKVIKINDPNEAMLSCSLHRSCKSTTSITDVTAIFNSAFSCRCWLRKRGAMPKCWTLIFSRFLFHSFSPNIFT